MNIMVQSESLSILSLAIGGRMTPQRIWRIGMHKGWSAPHTSGFFTGFKGIDYGRERVEGAMA
jgi:hypothetical protein